MNIKEEVLNLKQIYSLYDILDVCEDVSKSHW